MTDNRHELENGVGTKTKQRNLIAGFISSCKGLIAGPHIHDHAPNSHTPDITEGAITGADLNGCCGANVSGLDAAVQAHNDLVAIWKAEATVNNSANS